MCGELRASHIGTQVILKGWVHSRRDLGGLIFVVLRDRTGIVQVAFSPERDKGLYEAGKALRPEFVVEVTGTVGPRPEGMMNPDMPTGEVEVAASALSVLNKAETPPIPVDDDAEVTEDMRLRYRYIDLRRPRMQNNLFLRHKAYQSVRAYYDANGFIEVETPILMKSTPEGARDFLVPSRLHPGTFYALPQSPQTYKQILMVAGFDRYFQIVKCFRDEDLRADRQLEFTQIDVEMSFVGEDDVLTMTEGCIRTLFKDVLGTDVPERFERMTYKEAMEQYGSDKPDTRFELRLTNISETAAGTPFRVFKEAVEAGGIVTALRVPGAASMSRSQIDNLTARAKSLGAGGLVWLKQTADKTDCSIAKVAGEEGVKALVKASGAAEGDLVLIVSGPWAQSLTVLGTLRLEVIEKLGIPPTQQWKFLWVTEFPLLEWDPEEKRHVAVHHPFTSPRPEDVHLLDTEPLNVRARAYDLVLNGNEIAGGSIRIHDSELQSKMFRLLGIGPEEARAKFGFMLDAFRFGAPPHGGIAYGFDRTVMLMAGEGSIRDVIAFPKTTSGSSLMDDCPSPVDERQLQELGIAIRKKK